MANRPGSDTEIVAARADASLVEIEKTIRMVLVDNQFEECLFGRFAARPKVGDDVEEARPVQRLGEEWRLIGIGKSRSAWALLMESGPCHGQQAFLHRRIRMSTRSRLECAIGFHGRRSGL